MFSDTNLVVLRNPSFKVPTDPHDQPSSSLLPNLFPNAGIIFEESHSKRGEMFIFSERKFSSVDKD
jgi:hypothetical protein